MVGKHPKYIIEKFKNAKRLDDPMMLLDTGNKVKFLAWMNKWNITDEVMNLEVD